MWKIIQLDPILANQIAAWEVVERPISVVKELIENSIDAGANNIKIEIEHGGIDRMVIHDNGEWIEKDDLELITGKHTTSKIKNLADLQNVMSFWFRGEAIASIASVSELEIVSKHIHSDTWYRLKDGSIAQEALETGTKIIVGNLFSRTPARLNYLKKPRTEYTKIYEYIRSIALIYPEIWFEFINDDTQVCIYRPSKSYEERITQILWEDFGNNILAIQWGTEWLTIDAYISDPKIHFKNKNKQLLYVNKRLIKSPMIYRAISDAYNRYIPHGTHPAYLINITIDPTQVDVNVHPRKQEIRFADESQVFRLVYHAIHEKLQALSLVHWSVWTNEHIQQTEKNPEYYTGSGTKFKSYSPYKNTEINPAQWNIQDALNFSKALTGNSNTHWDYHVDTTSHPFETSNDLHITKMWKIIGQAFNSYIIVETAGSLQILDQHALAERIIYERLIQQGYKPKTQWLLLAESFNLSASEFLVVENHKKILKEFGFEMELLGNNILQVSGIPDFVKKENLRDIVESVIEDLENSKIGKSQTLEEVRNKIAAYASCRSAIKFGHKLSLLEMNTLLNDAVTDYSATCPHGRPVISDLDLETLKNMYDR